VPHHDPERAFEEHVAARFRLYSALFLELPYDLLQRVGRLLPVFAEYCRKELPQQPTPRAIVDSFFAHNSALADVPRADAIFLFLQLVERQIVLFDALEDASFSKIHDLDEPGSVTHLLDGVYRDDRRGELARLLGQTATRIVLTAHPTQFYPDTVQGVIDDLRPALDRNDPAEVERLLLQLGKTRFSNPARPSPVAEARSVLRSLDEVFYQTLADIAGRMLVGAHGRARLPEQLPKRPNLQIGFWPGGDRDGNPVVTAQVTREVARLLHEHVLERHLATARRLARRLTFDGAYSLINRIVARLRITWLSAAGEAPGQAAESPARHPPYGSARELQDELLALRQLIVRDHQSLFLDQVDDFIVKVHLFGFHFASLDLRQASDVLFATLREWAVTAGDVPFLAPSERHALVTAKSAQAIPVEILERLMLFAEAAPAEVVARLSPLGRDALEMLRLVPEIQTRNGDFGLHRVVISQTRGPEDPLVLLVLARLAGLGHPACLDVVPLFESIRDLEAAESTLERLLRSSAYRKLLAGREDRQIVMMGFSDGTKDGGYLTANWSIRRAKQRLTRLGRRYGIRIIFFDGRGGPPARGGGNTHRFYRSRDANIEQWETQLTIQGQTISSNFGSPDIARYHVEQLYTANLENLLEATSEEDPPAEFLPLLDELSARAMQAYRRLRNHPLLPLFLSSASPLPLFDYLTHASRPVSRGGGGDLDLDQVRAIPFVAAWSVLKIQISGFYGLGTALEHVFAAGREREVQRLCRSSRFFRALLDNAAMSLLKSRFDITAHLEHDQRFAPLWIEIRDEAARVERCILAINGQPWLLANDPVIRASIHYRDGIMLPLLVIVHDAFFRYHQEAAQGRRDSNVAVEARRMALKGIAAVINATRNAA
jgi:phosphoenolpyruvate carboxylase